MRSLLRLTTLAALWLMTAWAVPGCSPDETAGGKMQGAASSGKMEGGAMDKGKMEGGAMDKRQDGRRHGQGQDGSGAMDKGKMEGAMDKGKM